MANALTKNPISLDTAGATSLISTSLIIDCISIKPTNTAWAVVIHDAASGDIVVDQNGAAKEPLVIPFPAGLKVTGLYATTLTNAAVQVYLR